ncbi:hypothetical protein BGZ58_007670 [Dissophora ornata]|nr:hypothetical protein BGZ58_007670 [Dissophora ornata]
MHIVLEATGSSSNSDGDEPADALNAHSHDQDHDSAGWSEETATVEAAELEHSVEAEEPVLGDTDREALLSIVERASHRVCEWIMNGTCVACRFQEFQRACIDSLVNNEIRKTEVADVMAIIGVFAPSMSTRRMKEAFSKKLLCALVKSDVELPDVDFDDSAMMKAVRSNFNAGLQLVKPLSCHNALGVLQYVPSFPSAPGINQCLASNQDLRVRAPEKLQ